MEAQTVTEGEMGTALAGHQSGQAPSGLLSMRQTDLLHHRQSWGL
jgi:hypothetical protein